MGNLREAIRAQSRDVCRERKPQDQEKKSGSNICARFYLADWIINRFNRITLSIASIARFAQQMIISALYLDSIEWLKPAGI